MQRYKKRAKVTGKGYKPAIPKLIFFDFLFMTGHNFSLPRFSRQVKKVSACCVLLVFGLVTLNIREQGFSKRPVWRVGLIVSIPQLHGEQHCLLDFIV
jgi:hypothetical protein